MGFGLTFSAIVILLALFEVTVSAQQCSPISGSIFEDCSIAGYNQTFRVPFELSSKSKKWIKLFTSYIVKLPKNNCSVALMGETILCSVYAPSCTEGNPNPNLPCRRVCSEFLKRCRAHIDPFWLEYYVGYCTLLPNKTASSGQCYEPEGFEEHYNASTTGLLEDKCNRLVFPWCKAIGYDHSIVKESTQISSYESLYGKNFTNATDAHTSTNDSAISFWNKLLSNYSSCALEIRKMICADLFPPCFPAEGLAFYTICESTCRSIRSKCTNIDASSSFGKYLTYCEAVASGNSSHGFCKHTSWPKPLHWINFFREYPKPTPSSSPKKGMSTPVIVAIVIVPLIVIGLVVLGVVFWRQRRLPWIDRLFKRADDTKGFVSDDPTP